MDEKIAEASLSYYEANKQLMKKERSLDPIELNLKIIDIREILLENGVPNYLMLLCNERKDYTIFEFKNTDITALKNFEKDFRECLINRGTVLTIAEKENENNVWEIWIRDEKEENFCYYLFDYSEAVLVY